MASQIRHLRSGDADKRPAPEEMVYGQLAVNYSADSRAVFFKDSADGVTKVGPTHVGPTAPNLTPAGSAGNSVGESWLDTSDPAALILKIWDGAQWSSAAGVVGPQGPAGPAGADGAPGADSTVPGPKGDPGADGAPGADSTVPGPKGDPGADGAPGADSTVPGPAGPAGADSTVPGPQGPPGLDSSVPGPQGPAGSPGADSVVPGPEGPQGPAGPAGADSTVPGPQGPPGLDSTVPGPQGPAGADSTVPGPQGPAGADGAAGPQGPAGPTAVSTDAGNTSTLGTDGLIFTPASGGSQWTDIGGSLTPTAGGSVGVDSSSKFILGFDAFGGAEIYYDGVDGHLKLSPRETFHTVLPNGYLGIGIIPDSLLHVGLGTPAGLRIGYQDTSVNYYDADTHNFRTGDGTQAITVDANLNLTVAGLAGTGTEMVVADGWGTLSRQPIGSGPQGPAGADGAPGAPGLDGAAGPQGPAGPTAVSTDAGNTSTLGTDGLIYTPTGAIILPATLAEAAAGTINTAFLSPETGVPKDAPGMTGAALLPGGADALRPAAPVPGMLRWNTDPASLNGNRVEVYDSVYPAWRQLEYASQPQVTTTYTVQQGEWLSGAILCDDFIVPAGVTASVIGSLYVYATGDVSIQGTLNGNELGTMGAASFATGCPIGLQIYVGPGFGIGGGSTTTGGRRYTPQLSLAGSGGAGGFCANGTGSDTAGSSGLGGASGASLLIRAQGSITVEGTGSIGMSGGPGQIFDRASNMVVTGPGGGSGGVVIFHANGNCTNIGTIYARGGYGEGPHNGGCGGGGGGGGIVILQSDFGTSSLGYLDVAGGPGAPGVAATIGGGGGGGCGGRGGDSGAGAVADGSAGEGGFYAKFGSPF